MKKAALIATTAMIAIGPAVGDAAQDKSSKSCPQDAICVWAKADYRGKRVVVRSDAVSNKIAKRLNNRASSIKNRFGQTIQVFDKRNATGEIRCVSSQSQVADLGDSYNFDNRATSSDVPDDPQPCF